MKTRGFTIIELLVVLGIIVVLASLLLPALFANLEGARIEETRSRLKILQAALDRYEGAFGTYPLPVDTGDNAGAETLLAALRTPEGGGPFLQEQTIRTWLADTDGDGRQELVDSWGTPWIYFHNTAYTRGPVYYRIGGRRVSVAPVQRNNVYPNLTTYQLWACGPDKTNQSGAGDDVGNVLR